MEVFRRRVERIEECCWTDCEAFLGMRYDRYRICLFDASVGAAMV